MSLNRLQFSKFFSSLGLIWLLLSISLPPPVLAQTYTLGYTLYTRGDFHGAIDAFRKTLSRKRPSSQEERAQLFKYMGISHYMLGEMREASRSMSAGLRLNPQLTIDPKEVLDETVIVFFQQVASKLNSTQNSNQNEENNAISTSLDRASSTVLIQSNATNAEVLINGKVVGRANRAFDSMPGVIEVEVQAKGYESKQVRLSIKARQSNNFEVKLKRQGNSTPPSTKPSSDAAVVDARSRRVVLPEEKKIDAIPLAGSSNRSSTEKRLPPGEIPLPIAAPTSASSKQRPVEEQSPPAVANSGQQFNFLSLLPFGIGQFNNGQYLAGTVFALSEATLLGFYYQSTLEEDFIRQQARQFIQRESNEGNISFEDLERYRLDVNRVIQGEQQKQQLFLASFGILWVTGIAHAIITSPSRQTVSYLPPESYKQALVQPRQIRQQARIGIAPTPQGWSLQLAVQF